MNALRPVAFLLGLVAVVSHPTDGRAEAAGCWPPFPCFSTSTYDLTPAANGCQYRFAPAGASDHPVFQFRLADAFDFPMPDWVVELELVPLGSSVVCRCGDELIAISDAAGTGEIPLGFVGGKGEFDLVVYGTQPGTTNPVAIHVFYGLQFTSVDQNATCDPLEPATTILDLGVWAQGLPPQPYVRTSDFNCDGTVNVIDLGGIGAGLIHGCAP